MTGHNQELWKRKQPTFQTDFLVRERIPGYLIKVKGKHILDAGCGEGYVSRKLQNLGAIVSAFDIDKEMIRLAKEEEQEKSNPISYTVGNLLNVHNLYPKNSFDIAILSGVICFLDEYELDSSVENIREVIKDNGKLLIATNHTDSYFNHAKSNWLEYLSEPNPSLETQKMSLNFNNHLGQKLYTGECYIHTPKKVIETLINNGFEISAINEPLATLFERVNYPHMWGDEYKVPYHLIVVAKKV